jgi:xanthine dehydrogenase accessory factor
VQSHIVSNKVFGIISSIGGKTMRELVIGIKGAGEMASGVAHCLYQANFSRIVMMETAAPLAIRRLVSFSSAIHSGETSVESVGGVRAENRSDVRSAWAKNKIPIIADPHWVMAKQLKANVIIDAILAKKNLGTTTKEAEMVIALGPGFVAGKDAHVVIETNRGHNLGRLIFSGGAEKNTGIPGVIGGYSTERVLRAPVAGLFIAKKKICDIVQAGECIGTVKDQSVRAEIGGVIRGLINDGSPVSKGLKIGDIDPRGQTDYCFSISDKARAIGGAVLTSIMMQYNCPTFGIHQEADRPVLEYTQCA